MDRDRSLFPGPRVWASWAILGLATLARTVFVGWLGWLSLSALAVSRALAGMAHMPAPQPRPLGCALLDAAELGGAFGLVAGIASACVAGAQRLALGRPRSPLVLQDPLPQWVARSSAAAAIATSAWLFVVAVWNRLDGMPSLTGALAELIFGSIVEVGAVVVVQRRLLARARFRPAIGPR